jgi:RNA polymerase sigma factor (sigma-70 family)
MTKDAQHLPDSTNGSSRQVVRLRNGGERQTAAERRLDAQLLERIRKEHARSTHTEDALDGPAAPDEQVPTLKRGLASRALRPCPEYEVLANRLFEYAVPVIKNLLRNGAIRKELLARRLPTGGLTSDDYERLHTSMPARDALAIAVVIAGEYYFRRTVIPKKMWSAEGGTSLETFFVNGCMLHFASSVRSWKKEHPEWSNSPRSAESPEVDTETSADIRASDMMDAVENRDLVNRLLAKASPMVETILRLMLEGFSFAEIGERVGLSERAVEGRLHRFRAQVNKDVQRGRLDLPPTIASQCAA